MPKIDHARWLKLSPFLDEALEREGAERVGWIESLRVDNAEVARDLQSLLGPLQALDERGFLESDPTNGLLSEPSLEGHTLGAYTLESVLGRGGMGTVWLARRHDGHFEGKVAVKLLNLALHGRDGGQERFRREGRVLGKLTHPNIARIIDAGVTHTGQLYLVLEYVEGCDIARYCDDRGLTIQARIKLFLDVLEAVGHAHANLIVHRDIKPSNIYVTQQGVVKLLDFGVAKLLEGDDQESATQLTRDGVRALTPQFAAPEQVLDAPITVATDVYALGVLLYLLLSGQHPTGEKNTSALQHIRCLLEAEPTRLSEAAISKSLKRVLRGDLDNIVAKALKKNPQERYASVREFADDLKRYLHDEPVLARADNTIYRVRKFVARNRLPVILGGAALLAVLATAAVALSQARMASGERDRALALSSRNEAVAEFLEVLLTEGAAAGKPVSVSDMLARSEALVRSEYRDNPEHRAAVLGMLGNHYYTNEQYVRAEALLREARDVVRTSTDGDLKRRLACDHALILPNLGKNAEAIRLLDEVIQDPQITAKQSALCLEDRTMLALQGDDPVKALEYGNLALERLYQAASPAPGTAAVFLANLGFAAFLNSRNDLAEEYYERSLAQYERSGRDRGPVALSVRNNWAMVSDGAGNPKRGLELYDELVRIGSEQEPNEPRPILLYNRARELQNLGRYNESRESYQQCLAHAERTKAPLNKINCFVGLGTLAHELGDFVSAGRYADSLAEVIGASPPPGALGKLQYLRAQIALAKGRLDEARTNLDSVVADSKNVYSMMAMLRTRAELNLTEGKMAAAESDARRALSLAQAAQGRLPHSNRSGLAYLILGRVLAQQGRAAQANSAFHAAAEHLASTVDADHPMLLLARQLERSQPPGD